MLSYWKQLRKSSLAQSLLIVTACLVVYLLGPISTYETNDDVFISLAFSGKLITSAPDPHVIFINFALAQIFVKLYTLLPAIPWHGLFQIMSVLASVFFLNYCFSVTRNNDNFLMRMAVSLATAVPFLILIQFTKTAVVLGVAGYLGLYLLQNISPGSRPCGLKLHVIAVSFLIVSFLLRKESFFLATILCSFLMLYAFLKPINGTSPVELFDNIISRKINSNLLKGKTTLIISLSVAAVLIMAFALLHQQKYGADWRDFLAVKKVVDQFVDYHQISYNSNQELFNKAGLSRNDYDFLMSWGYSDGRIYSKERMNYISHHSQKKAVVRGILPVLMIAKSFPAKHYIITLSALTLLMLIIYQHNYQSLCIYVLLPFLICAGILVWQGRFPPRVSTAMAYFIPWAIIVQSGESRKRLLSKAVAVVTMLLLALSIYAQFQDLSSIAQNRLTQNQDLHRFGKLILKRPVIVAVLGASFPFEGIFPFETDSYLSGARFIWLSSGLNQTPLQKKQLADNGIEDIFIALIKDSSTYIVVRPVLTSILQRYIYEHYQKYIVAVPAYHGKSFTLYKLMSLSTSLNITN